MKSLIKIFKNVVFEGDEKTLSSRERAYFVRGYVNRPNDSLSLLFQSAEHWAFVWHDKDDKTPHCHFIVRFKYNKTPSAFARILRGIDPVQNWHFSALRDKYSAFDYLHHRDEKSIEQGKARYNEGEVLTDDIAYFTRGGQGARDNLAFYNDLVENNLSHVEMARKYGRDYLKNMARYDEAKEILQSELNPKPNDTPEGLQAIPAEYFPKSLAEEMLYSFVKQLKVHGQKFSIEEFEVDAIIQDLTKQYFL